jgi:hypothetical protein
MRKDGQPSAETLKVDDYVGIDVLVDDIGNILPLW